jgi:hypothetical protein
MKKEKLNITKEEFLSADKYIFTSKMITKNGVTGWDFYLLKNGEFKRVIGGKTWSDKKDCHRNTAWGVNRALDLLLAIGYDLGLKMEEIDQKKLMIL